MSLCACVALYRWEGAARRNRCTRQRDANSLQLFRSLLLLLLPFIFFSLFFQFLFSILWAYGVWGMGPSRVVSPITSQSRLFIPLSYTRLQGTEGTLKIERGSKSRGMIAVSVVSCHCHCGCHWLDDEVPTASANGKLVHTIATALPMQSNATRTSMYTEQCILYHIQYT